MRKTKLAGALLGTSMLATMILGSSVVFAAGGGSSSNTTAVQTDGTLSPSGTYTYPKDIQVTITSADTSLMPVTPSFKFANAAPTFNPAPSYNGSGTFTLPSGFTAESATSVTVDSSSKPKQGIYVFDVGVPASMQTSKYSSLFVFSNYQWATSQETPVNNYSTLVNLVQQLPEVPLAAIIPAVILAGWALKRRSNKRAALPNS